MAEHVLKNIKVCVDAVDLTCYANSLTLEQTADMLDTTAFCDDSARTFLAGLIQNSAQYGGWLDMETTDSVIDALVGASSASILSFGVEDGAADGTIAYVTQGRVSSYQRLGAIGEIAPYDLTFQGTGWLGRGAVAVNSAVTSTSDSAGSQLGALSATQTLYSAVHATVVSGTSPTMDIIIESDDNAGFTGATTRITHTQLTAVGSELSSVAGAVTDDYWRAGMTIGGTATPTFQLFIVLAIV